jgi:exodeoxyribonuclease-3
MKIATWNINSVRLRTELLNLLNTEEEPDVVLLQETKTEDQFFPVDEIKKIGYEYQVFTGEKSYNGVAILSKFPVEESFSLAIYNQDKRHISAKINGVEIHNFYVPAGGDIPDIDSNPKFLHKLEYLKEIKSWFLKNRNKNDKILLAGDLNIAPFEHDVWSSKQLRNEVSHTDIEREILIDVINSFDWCDVARHFVDKKEKLYSWWSYRNRDWEKSNRGRRLDHIWVSKTLLNNCKSFRILKNSRSWEKPSDHVPVILFVEIR